MRAIFITLTLLFLVDASASNLMYPELNVAPKASERLRIEASMEGNTDWTTHLPIQISALSTIVAASQLASADLEGDLSSEEEDDEEAKQSLYSMIGMGVGAFWIGASVYASMKYRPYLTSYKRVKAIKGTSIRDQLTQERLAEEELNSLRRFGRTVRWASVATNLLASLAMSEVEVDTEESNAKAFSTASALLAFTPLFFKYRWEHVADEQEKYKKRIYSPVAYAPIMFDPFGSGKSATGMNLIFTF